MDLAFFVLTIVLIVALNELIKSITALDQKLRLFFYIIKN